MGKDHYVPPVILPWTAGLDLQLNEIYLSSEEIWHDPAVIHGPGQTWTRQFTELRH